MVGTALTLIPPSSAFSAVGVVLAVSSLGSLADAMRKMGKMSWGEIGKSLTELAGALTLLTLALDHGKRPRFLRLVYMWRRLRSRRLPMSWSKWAR